MQDLCPYLAVIEGSLPGRATERQRVWSSLDGICIGAEEVGDDLEVLPEEARKRVASGRALLTVQEAPVPLGRQT